MGPALAAWQPSLALPHRQSALAAQPRPVPRWQGAHPHRLQRPLATATQNGTEVLSPAAAELVEEDDSDDDVQGLSNQQVQTLLHVLCEETELAELELKMGSFEVKVRRSAAMANSAGAQQQQLQVPVGNPFSSTASMDFSDGQQPAAASQPSVDESTDDEDESLIAVEATKVGFMRRSRYVKGKKVGKGPLVEAGTRVKKGQPICFIEQLGTFVPVEAPHAGEISNFLVEEGKSVEYKQELVEMYPFFGGHIIGDKKHA